MMGISDNRTTRGTVIRYGGFAPFNTTASTGGPDRHDAAPQHRLRLPQPGTGKYEPTTRRNDTTAADLGPHLRGRLGLARC